MAGKGCWSAAHRNRRAELKQSIHRVHLLTVGMMVALSSSAALAALAVLTRRCPGQVRTVGDRGHRREA